MALRTLQNAYESLQCENVHLRAVRDGREGGLGENGDASDADSERAEMESSALLRAPSSWSEVRPI